MMYRSKITLLSILLLLVVISNAAALGGVPGDSVRVERTGDKTFILHKVSYGETLFSLSRKYQVAVEEIREANETLKQGLKSGQTIRIPKDDFSTPVAASSMHKVAYGETLFSISKKYGVTVELLQQWNNLGNNSLKAGQNLIIKESLENQPTLVSAENSKKPIESTAESPKVSPVTVSTKPTEKDKETRTPVTPTVNLPSENKKPSVKAQAVSEESVSIEWMYHTVRSGETLFSISSQYGRTLEELIQWNSLSSNNLKSGQTIKVGKGAEAVAKTEVKERAKKPAVSSENKAITMEAGSGGFQNIRETGLAQVIEGTGDHKKYLVLHRTAPVGNVIRVKNEENNITIFARVVGSLPETGDNSKLVVMLSQAAFDQLKAVNSRFPVEVLY